MSFEHLSYMFAFNLYLIYLRIAWLSVHFVLLYHFLTHLRIFVELIHSLL